MINTMAMTQPKATDVARSYMIAYVLRGSCVYAIDEGLNPSYSIGDTANVG